LKDEQEIRMAAFKHEQEKEIADLKSQLAYLGDRGTRSNEREYVSTVDLWASLVKAFWSTRGAVISFLSHPDLNAMDNDKITDYLELNSWPQKDINSVLQAEDSNRMFARIVQVKNINASRDAIGELRLKLQNAIFVTGDLESDIEQLMDLMLKAEISVSRRSDRQAQSSTHVQWETDFVTTGEERFRAIKEKIRNRLVL
jgi:hypothetical protein